MVEAPHRGFPERGGPRAQTSQPRLSVYMYTCAQVCRKRATARTKGWGGGDRSRIYTLSVTLSTLSTPLYCTVALLFRTILPCGL